LIIPKFTEIINLFHANFDEIIKSIELLKGSVGDKFIYHRNRLDKILESINRKINYLYKISEEDIRFIRLLIEEGL